MSIVKMKKCLKLLVLSFVAGLFAAGCVTREYYKGDMVYVLKVPAVVTSEPSIQPIDSQSYHDHILNVMSSPDNDHYISVLPIGSIISPLYERLKPDYVNGRVSAGVYVEVQLEGSDEPMTVRMSDEMLWERTVGRTDRYVKKVRRE
ncbi:MAG: hypothetical protein AAF492_10480 [Verrucomicrobiota bacterium]